MLSDEIGRQLHDRSTRGKALTSVAHRSLEKWYDQQDNKDSRLLHRDDDLRIENILHKQIDPILIRISTAAEQIHKLTDENRVLRENIAKLQRQLPEKTRNIKHDFG